MRQLIQDLQYALRMLAKNPAFTLAVVLMLALGIGVNASVFSFIDFMLLQPLPVPEANRIVVVSRGDTTLFSHPDYSDYRNRTRAFTALAASTPTEASFDLEGQSEAITAEAVSASYQDVMRVPLVSGQWFTSTVGMDGSSSARRRSVSAILAWHHASAPGYGSGCSRNSSVHTTPAW